MTNVDFTCKNLMVPQGSHRKTTAFWPFTFSLLLVRLAIFTFSSCLCYCFYSIISSILFIQQIFIKHLIHAALCVRKCLRYSGEQGSTLYTIIAIVGLYRKCSFLTLNKYFFLFINVLSIADNLQTISWNVVPLVIR